MATAPANQRERHFEVRLDAGTLTLEIDRAAGRLDELCAFAARRNPRRAFLIVSRVLGRHIPARPSTMRAAARRLVAEVPSNLPGPILTVGLAETAVCLGQMVHEEMVRLRSSESHYLYSTRQQIDAPLLCRFEEPHSHACAHLIYRPVDLDLARVRTLLLVDDEISTGTTLSNLAAAIAGHLPRLERIAVAALTDWTGGDAWLRALPRPASSASLLQGRLDWRPAAGAAAQPEPGLSGATARLGSIERHWNSGRLGIAAGAAIRLPEYRPAAKHGRLRIVGTGEFTYPPFLLAEQLEAAGWDVVVQATSRSPIVPGGAIGSVLRFADNYGTGVPNFLYNADSADARHTVICHETPPGSIDRQLRDALGADTLFFGVG